MPFLLFPDAMYKTVYDIDVDALSEKYTTVFFDIDNTLVPYDVSLPTQNVKDLVSRMRNAGLRVVFVSNNSKERVGSFCDPLGAEYIHEAKKPLISEYKAFCERENIDMKKCVAIGDQLFTDVLAARLLGFDALLVEPIKKVENRFFRFKRACERPFIAMYRQKSKKKKMKK